METFGYWLENELKNRGWKPADLANKADLSRGSLSNILNDMRKPGPEVCQRIADALEIPEEIIFREAGLLRTKPEMDANIEELLYLYRQLSEADRKRLLQSARAWVGGR